MMMEIPCFHFGKGELEEGSEEWKGMSKKVREACETYRCFLLTCDEIPEGLHEKLFEEMKGLFDLPEGTKMKHQSPKPFSSYNHTSRVHLLMESFGIDDSSLFSSFQSFTNLMWPQGNPTLCETLRLMGSKMLELSIVVMKMIVEGYGLPQRLNSDVENMMGGSSSRLLKYKVPVNDNEIALTPHTDKVFLSLICQNGVQGFQVLSKFGQWIQPEIPHHGFVVVVGDLLQAWSNGRLQAGKHRVVMSSSDNERYSFGFFAKPNEDINIEVPHELVDDKDHPIRYRPFKYGEYFSHYVKFPKDDALEEFAGFQK